MTMELVLLVVECEDELGLLVVEEELLKTEVVLTLLAGNTWPLPSMLPVGLKESDECGKPELRMLYDGLKLPDGLRALDECANPVPVSV